MSESEQPKRYVNVALSIEECDETGRSLTVEWDAKREGKVSVFVTKRLELSMLMPENVLTARQHQVREMAGEERSQRDSGQYLGIALPAEHDDGYELMKAAIMDYLAARLGVGHVVKTVLGPARNVSKPTT